MYVWLELFSGMGREYKARKGKERGKGGTERRGKVMKKVKA